MELLDYWAQNSDPVATACCTFIRQGDIASVRPLADFLRYYWWGDKGLAEDYLNCGQDQLRDAALEWARSRGYSIKPGVGSFGGQWGQDRDK